MARVCVCFFSDQNDSVLLTQLGCKLPPDPGQSMDRPFVRQDKLDQLRVKSCLCVSLLMYVCVSLRHVPSCPCPCSRAGTLAQHYLRVSQKVGPVLQMRVLRSFCSESVVKQALTGSDVAIEAHACKTSVTCTLDMEQKMSHTMQCL